jgi:hypothetical protein
MTSRALALLRAHLPDDERVIWCGRPLPGAYIFRNWMYSAFGLFWLALSVMWLLSVKSGGLPIGFCLVAVPFLILAAWMTIGHIVWAATEVPNVAYIITDWRVLMSYGWPRVKTRTIPLARIAELDLWPRHDGYGDIRLGVELGYWDGARWAKASSFNWGSHETVLRGLPACNQVYAELSHAIHACGGGVA